jgi:hypothetical protein
LVSFINNKFFVKEYEIESDVKEKISPCDEDVYRKLGGSIQKLCNNSETVCLIPQNFQKIDTLATKA